MVMLTADDDADQLKEVYGVNEADLVGGAFTVFPTLYAYSAYESQPLDQGVDERMLVQYAAST